MGELEREDGKEVERIGVGRGVRRVGDVFDREGEEEGGEGNGRAGKSFSSSLSPSDEDECVCVEC